MTFCYKCGKVDYICDVCKFHDCRMLVFRGKPICADCAEDKLWEMDLKIKEMEKNNAEA